MEKATAWYDKLLKTRMQTQNEYTYIGAQGASQPELIIIGDCHLELKRLQRENVKTHTTACRQRQKQSVLGFTSPSNCMLAVRCPRPLANSASRIANAEGSWSLVIVLQNTLRKTIAKDAGDR